MQKDKVTAQMFMALGAMVVIAPHLPEVLSIVLALYIFWRIYKLDKN